MIYFVKGGDFVKIGYTNNLNLRMREIQVSCPHHLSLLATCEGDKRTEAMFHDMAAPYHHRAEWFKFSGELKRWLLGKATVFKMAYADGASLYCFASDIDREKVLAEWCRSNNKEYEEPTCMSGPAIVRCQRSSHRNGTTLSTGKDNQWD